MRQVSPAYFGQTKSTPTIQQESEKLKENHHKNDSQQQPGTKFKSLVNGVYFFQGSAQTKTFHLTLEKNTASRLQRGLHPAFAWANAADKESNLSPLLSSFALIHIPIVKTLEKKCTLSFEIYKGALEGTKIWFCIMTCGPPWSTANGYSTLIQLHWQVAQGWHSSEGFYNLMFTQTGRNL